MIQHRKFEQNKLGTDFVVSDIHGCYDELMFELNMEGFDFDRDRLFCAGDLIDRGSQNQECINLLNESWFFSTVGNHDYFMMEHEFDHVDAYNWVRNGGAWAFQKYLEDERIEMAKLLSAKLHHTMEVEYDGYNIGIVHATPLDDWKETVNKSEENLEKLIWSRTRIRNGDSYRVSNIDVVVVGHTVVKEPVVLGNVLYIDTGLVYGNKLTIFTLEDVVNKIIQR